MAGCLLPSLPVEVEERIIGLLGPNEVQCTIRLVNKASAAHYRGPELPTVRLSLPVPHHALTHRCEANAGAWIKGISLKKRLKLLRLTAASGDLANLALAVRAAGCLLRGEVMEAAAAAGHIHVCQWLRDQDCPWAGALAAAAKAGRRDVCEWLLTSGCPADTPAVYAAARGGHLGLMEWLRQQLPPDEMDPCDEDLVAAVAYGCDLAALQRVYMAWRDAMQQLAQDEGWNEQQQQQLDDEEDELNSRKRNIIDLTFGTPTPDWREKVGWLEAQGCRCSSAAAVAAARMPAGAQTAVERLRWLRERGYPLDTTDVEERTAIEAAAEEGNVTAIAYLLGEAGVEVWYAADRAADRGHLAVLQLLHDHGRPVILSRCLSGAAREGRLPVVSWLADTFGLTAADLQREAVGPAVASGSVELVDWLAGRGCDFSPDEDGFMLDAAVRGGCEVLLERLVELGRQWPDGGWLFADAGRHGDMAMLLCLRRLGCPWDAHGLSGILSKMWTIHYPRDCPLLPALRWMVEAGCPVDWAGALQEARRLGNMGLPTVLPTVEYGVRDWLEEGSRQSQRSSGARR